MLHWNLISMVQLTINQHMVAYMTWPHWVNTHLLRTQSTALISCQCDLHLNIFARLLVTNHIASNETINTVIVSWGAVESHSYAPTGALMYSRNVAFYTVRKHIQENMVFLRGITISAITDWQNQTSIQVTHCGLKKLFVDILDESN